MVPPPGQLNTYGETHEQALTRTKNFCLNPPKRRQVCHAVVCTPLTLPPDVAFAERNFPTIPGVNEPDPLRECAGGYQGYVKGGWAHKHVLQPMVQCALDAECLTPSGSSRANHRQDQSILNALLCRHVQENRLSGMPCQRDRRWWMWDDQSTLLPPKNETQWRDDLVFFLRRSTVVQPYLRHLVEEQKTHKQTEQQVVVGQATEQSVDSNDDGVLFFS